VTSPFTCPLCDSSTLSTAFGDLACAQCGLAGSLSVLTAVARLRRENERRARKMVNAYRERSRCVAAIAWLALRAGMRAGLGRHTPDPDPSWDPSWLTVVYVETPSGLVSWHVPDTSRYLVEGLPTWDPGWDGHTLTEKHRRLDELRNGADLDSLQRLDTLRKDA
jgi:hypothetical protein